MQRSRSESRQANDARGSGDSTWEKIASGWPIESPRWTIADLPWSRIFAWALIAAVLYLARDFFFIIFLTFLLSYAMRRLIASAMWVFAPASEKPRLEKWVAITAYALLLYTVYGVGAFIGPKVVAQGQSIVGVLSKVDPEQEFHQFLARTIGAYLFRKQYGSESGKEYSDAFDEYCSKESPGYAKWSQFPRQLATIEAAFEAKHAPAQVSQLTRHVATKTVGSAITIEDREKKFERFYEDWRERGGDDAPPYDFATFLRLRSAYSKGQAAFAVALGAQGTVEDPDQLRADFRLSTQGKLAEEWWATDPNALVLRKRLGDNMGDMFSGISNLARAALAMALSIPTQLGTAVLLSFFINLDFFTLRRGVLALRESRLAVVYEEVAPGVVSLARLIGKSFQAQAVVSVINTLLTILAMWLIGIQNELLLGSMVFLFSFIPVFGVILSSVPIAIMAVTQPDGHLLMGIEAIGAILLIHFIESTVLSPRIVGNLMHIHPVAVIAVLFVGEHFFGIWGLLLGTPVAVHIYTYMILGEDVTQPKGEHE